MQQPSFKISKMYIKTQYEYQENIHDTLASCIFILQRY